MDSPHERSHDQPVTVEPAPSPRRARRIATLMLAAMTAAGVSGYALAARSAQSGSRTAGTTSASASVSTPSTGAGRGRVRRARSRSRRSKPRSTPPSST